MKPLERLAPEELAAIEVVAMDISAAFIKAVRERIRDADEKIAFARFHVAKHLNEVVNEVQKREDQALLGEGNRALVGTRCLWLKRRGVPAPRSHGEFQRVTRGMLKTARMAREH
ncbi:MAG: transposase, partial [Planctomycetes bacterium]|nr:transposase [Planctomycetota bacterium]